MRPVIGLHVLYHLEAGTSTGWLERVCPAIVQGSGITDSNLLLLVVFTPVGLAMIEALREPGEGVGRWKYDEKRNP